MPDGDYLNSDDQIENYVNEVQEWAMSHGASNEEGRMSRNFFKPGHSFIEGSYKIHVYAYHAFYFLPRKIWGHSQKVER